MKHTRERFRLKLTLRRCVSDLVQQHLICVRKEPVLFDRLTIPNESLQIIERTSGERSTWAMAVVTLRRHANAFGSLSISALYLASAAAGS